MLCAGRSPGTPGSRPTTGNIVLMLFPAVSLSELAAVLRRPAAGHRFAVVPTDVAPLDFVRAASPFFGSARYLATPGGPVVGGVGTAWRIESAGTRRFERLARQFETAPAMPEEAHLLFGFSFGPDGPVAEEWAPFPSTEVVLPAASVVEGPTGRHLVVAIPPGAEPVGVLSTLRDLVEPGPVRRQGLGDHWVHSVPSGEDWCASVDEAVGAISAGEVEKVVLARSVDVTTEMTIDPFETVAQLAERSPDCHLYGWQIGATSFIGASPELLVGKRGDTVRTVPLAGSARRGDGDHEDRMLGSELMSSAKNRDEHAFVVDDISERLTPLTSDLSVPTAPELRRTATVQHLASDIRGRLLPDVSLFDLAGRLHPTPAVGGTPQQDALMFIDKLETIDRGWYSGGVGWLSSHGDGDVALALRCALLGGSRARLYAGNGIVSDSVPEDELVETRWKFRPILNLLTVT